MIKIGAVFFLGITVGVTGALLYPQTPTESLHPEGLPAIAATTVPTSTGQSARSNEELLEQIAALQATVAELEQRRGLQIRVMEPTVRASSPSTGASVAERTLEWFASEGFTQQRAEQIEAKLDQLTDDRDARMRSLAESPFYRLRQEIGDEEYERFLRAKGLSTEVQARSIEEGSAAAAAGILPGDHLLTFDGRRIFDPREIEELSSQGREGEFVLVDIERDGQRMQLAVPRGPLGAQFANSGTTILDMGSL